MDREALIQALDRYNAISNQYNGQKDSRLGSNYIYFLFQMQSAIWIMDKKTLVQAVVIYTF